MRKLIILVTSAGRRCELIELLRQDARDLGFDPRIIAADASPRWSSACELADKSVQVPRATDVSYATAIEAIVQQEQCNILIPTIDPELRVFADYRHDWETRYAGLHLVSHGPIFVALCRDKAATAAKLESLGIGAPLTYCAPGLPKRDVATARWPLIGKPIDGSSSIGMRHICNADDFHREAHAGTLLIQEKVIGDEFTVNVYVGHDGQVKSIIPHRRLATRSGEVEKAEVERLETIESVVSRLVSSFDDIRGPFNLQLIRRPDDSIAVFEINARFGGGFPLAHRAGGHFTRWVIVEAMLGATIKPPAIEFGWRMMRCDRSFFARDSG